MGFVWCQVSKLLKEQQREYQKQTNSYRSLIKEMIGTCANMRSTRDGRAWRVPQKVIAADMRMS